MKTSPRKRPEFEPLESMVLLSTVVVQVGRVASPFEPSGTAAQVAQMSTGRSEVMTSYAQAISAQAASRAQVQPIRFSSIQIKAAAPAGSLMDTRPANLAQVVSSPIKFAAKTNGLVAPQALAARPNVVTTFSPSATSKAGTTRGTSLAGTKATVIEAVAPPTTSSVPLAHRAVVVTTGHSTSNARTA